MQGGPDVAPAIGFMFVLFFLFVGLLITLLMVWVYCRIFSKAGFCWALGLLMFVPVANITCYLFLPLLIGRFSESFDSSSNCSPKFIN